jgi:hypothetical protein
MGIKTHDNLMIVTGWFEKKVAKKAAKAIRMNNDAFEWMEDGNIFWLLRLFIPFWKKKFLYFDSSIKAED